MDLNRVGREFLDLGIVTDPEVTAWEASFDGGETWVEGDPVEGGARWLLAGEDAEDPEDEDDHLAVATITKTMHPLVRDVDNPEIIVRRGPLIRYSR